MATKKAPAKSTVAKKVPRKTVSVHRGASPTPELPPKFAQHLLELEQAFARVLDDVVSRYPGVNINFTITAVVTPGGGPPVNADGNEVKSPFTISSTDASLDRWVFVAYKSGTTSAPAAPPAITFSGRFKIHQVLNTHQLLNTCIAHIKRDLSIVSAGALSAKAMALSADPPGLPDPPTPRRRGAIPMTNMMTLNLSGYDVFAYRLKKGGQASITLPATPPAYIAWTRLATLAEMLDPV